MTIYHIEQDNTVWCCEEDSGPYYEDRESTFVKCECDDVWAGRVLNMEDHLQGHVGGGPVLNWREARDMEITAWYSGKDDAFEEGIEFAERRIIQWIESNRRKLELDDDVTIYRDSFNSQDLITFIKGKRNPHVRAETVDSELILEQKESKSVCSCGCKKED